MSAKSTLDPLGGGTLIPIMVTVVHEYRKATRGANVRRSRQSRRWRRGTIISQATDMYVEISIIKRGPRSLRTIHPPPPPRGPCRSHCVSRSSIASCLDLLESFHWLVGLAAVVC